jgi:hypothetical protein
MPSTSPGGCENFLDKNATVFTSGLTLSSSTSVTGGMLPVLAKTAKTFPFASGVADWQNFMGQKKSRRHFVEEFLFNVEIFYERDFFPEVATSKRLFWRASGIFVTEFAHFA